jgi:diguanylate cyclase (GGDEF)-like protein
MDDHKQINNSAHLQGWLLQRHLQEHAEGLIPALIGNIVNAIVAGVLFWSKMTPVAVIVGIAMIFGIVIHRFHISRKVALVTVNESARLQAISQEVTLNAAILGGSWGLATYYMMSIGSPAEHMFAGIMGSGMMAAGTITYRTLPKAAFAYLLTAGSGSFAALLIVQDPAAIAAMILLACYLLILTASVRKTFDRSCIRHLHEHQLSESAETIRLLLHDYEEQASDWLVTLDSEGQIVAPGTNFCAAAAMQASELEGLRLTDLLIKDENAARLRRNLKGKKAFREIKAALKVGDKTRWWAFSMRPREDGGWRGVVYDVTIQHEAEQKVQYLAHFDSLTNLPNRLLFNQRLTAALSETDTYTALLYVDLDNFKDVNDSLGHPVGDHLLQTVAQTLDIVVGQQGLVARLGGDEFAVICHPESEEALAALAEQIIDVLAKTMSINGIDIQCSASVGVATTADGPSDVSQFQQFADLALYAAKSSGRRHWRRFDTAMNDAAQVRRMVEFDLRHALSNGELRLHYQPLVDIQTGETTGCEALLRWESPMRGFVQPADFIPIAEESGLIVPIGEWVIREALNEARLMPDTMTISVNLSPLQMRSPNLIPTIMNALASSGVAASRLELEITETVLLHDSDANIATLTAIHDLGVRIALDDFGTGYSSLSYLRRFPFDKIKIDRSFVEDIDNREDCRAIIRSVVSLAQSLGITTTAEGVERTEQLDHLREEGCTHVQGFLFSKAVAADQLTGLDFTKGRRRAA